MVPDEDDEEEEDIPDDSLGVFARHTDAVYCVAVRKIERENEEPLHVVVTGSGDDTALVWNLATGQVMHTLDAHTDTVTDVAFNHDASMVATVGMDANCFVWNTLTGEKVALLQGASDTLDWVRWHPRGNVVLAGGADGVCFMWLAVTAKTMNFFTGHGDALTDGTFTADGKTIVTASLDGSVRVWNPKTAECPFRFEGPTFHEAAVNCVVCSPSSPVFASAGDDNMVFLCNYETGKILNRISNHTAPVQSLCFSLTMPHLISASSDGSVRVWDLNQSAERHVFEHEEPVVNVVAHPTEPLVVSCSLDRTVRVWDHRACEPVKVLRGHRDVVHALCLTANGEGLVSVSDDCTARIFSLVDA